MRNTHCRTKNISRKLKNMENETQTAYDLEYGERTQKNVENDTQTLFDMEYGNKHSETWKMRNEQCRTWSIARKLKNMEIEAHTL
jgi:hypothetical protein